MNRNRPAFTLLEIVLYVFVFGVLSVALYSFGNISFRTNAYSQSVAEVELSGSALMLKIVDQINRAAATGGVNYPGPGLASSSLSLLSQVSSSNPIIFSLNNGAMMMKEGASSSLSLSSNRVRVSDLSFVNLGTASSTVLQINFMVATNNSDGIKEYNYSRVFTSAANTLQR